MCAQPVKCGSGMSLKEEDYCKACFCFPGNLYGLFKYPTLLRYDKDNVCIIKMMFLLESSVLQDVCFF